MMEHLTFIKTIDSAATSAQEDTWINVALISAVAPGIDPGTSRVWTGYDTYWVTQETPKVFLDRLVAAVRGAS